ncbi:LTA synthase family protein [Pseudochryseolinea flava]|uniref:LTA synthase family protein n=1 Tax=Pseudochryseolinea flava TaxID=2059302 RepID=A0A364Y5Y7_9BACT|nr:LTA synthase family protein [Pseudochryseolinea flava]
MQFVKNIPLRGNIYYVLLLRLVVVMFLFTLCRIGFYLFNMSYFPGMTAGKFFSIFLGGIKFDITAVLYTNLLFILMMIVPLYVRFKQGYQTIVKWIFYIFNSLALAMNVGDFIYFKFTGRRTTSDIFQQFENEGNMGGLFFKFIIDYWYATLFLVALVVLMVWLYNQIELRGPVMKNKIVFYLAGIVALPLIAYLFVGAARGNFLHSTRPITLSDAGKYVHDPGDVSIVLNTPFALYRTLGKTKIKKVKYYDSEEKLAEVFTPIRHGIDSGEFKKMNVVVIVLESFSKEFFGFYNKDKENGTYKGYTPFLDSLIAHSRTFQYSFANGRKSIDALPSVVASVPSMGLPYVLSPFSGNRINSLGNILAKEGYNSAFFHGAPNGSMGFEAFMNVAGIQSYYGMTEYGNDADYDGWWGIWDEHFLQFTADTQKDFKEPFLSVFFSVSSHHPFSVPKKYEDVFKGGKEPILRCIQFTDHSLKKYFEKISTYPWFKNTLFVITADHTSSNVLFDQSRTAKGLFSIPIIFYRPDDSLLGVDSTSIIQQADVMPTVLGQLGYKKDFVAFGRDVFHSTSPSCAWNYKDDVFQYYEGDLMLQFDGKRSIALYNFKTDIMLSNNLVKDPSYKERVLQLEQKIKAIIQQYNNRMVDNNLTIR